jgi:hypothetical protein
MIDCKDIQQKMDELEALKKRLAAAAAEATKSGNMEKAKELAEEFRRKAREVSEQMDPHQTALRERIAQAGRYSYVGEFVNGAAFAEKDGAQWFLVDEGGRPIIERPFQGVSKFSPEGIAVVSYDAEEETPHFYIDTKGNELFHGYLAGGEFHEGRAWAFKNNHWILIDATGREIVKYSAVETGRMEDVHEGMSIINRNVQDSDVEIIDKEGTKIGSYRDVANRFSEGVAWVSRDRVGRGCLYIDTTGKELLPDGRTFFDAKNFSEGLAAVKEQTGRRIGHGWSFIDKSGRCIPERHSEYWEEAGDFHNGLAWVRDVTRRAYFINRQGERAFEGDFRSVNDFSEGMAAVVQDVGWWQFINTRGEVAFPGEFSEVTSFKEGVAAVKPVSSEKWIAIDTKGNTISPDEMETIEDLDREGLVVGGLKESVPLIPGTNLTLTGTKRLYFSRKGKRMFTQNK